MLCKIIMDPQVVNSLGPYKKAIEVHLIPDLAELIVGHLVEVCTRDGYSGSLVNGVQQGKWKDDHKREQLYVDGQLHGTRRGWHANGQLQYEDIYVKGKI